MIIGLHSPAAIVGVKCFMLLGAQKGGTLGTA